MMRMLSGVVAATVLVLALAAAAPADAQGVVEVRHGWRGGGVGIYIGPSYGYGGYDGYYSYGPRYGYYYDDDDYYDRSYHRHSHRWTRERFEHPLGRR